MKRIPVIVCALVLGSLTGPISLSAGQSDVPDPNNPRVTPVVVAFSKAKPAVVNISTTEVVRPLGLFEEDLFERFFERRLDRKIERHSLGSGVIIHPDGYIVTNAHVIQRAQRIHVTLADDSRYVARVIASTPTKDLAVLKIDPADRIDGTGDANAPAPKKLAYLPLGRSDDLMVGETVIAIGNPMGLANSLSRGVISATGRTLRFRSGVRIDELIQTDAPINPGNSGGPLLNIKGELIGINTAIRADAQNIGFAIPIDGLTEELANLLDIERVNRVVFGASIEQKRDDDNGGKPYLVVTDVRKKTPAEGKLRKGDRLVRMDRTRLEQLPDFVCGMLARKADDELKLRIQRGDEQLDVTVTLAEKPKPDGNKLASKLMGIRVRAVTPELAKDLSLSVDRGLLVTSVEEDSPAEVIGIRVKDVLFQIGRFYVTDLEGLGTLLEELQPGQAVKVGVARGSVAAWVTLRTRKGK